MFIAETYAPFGVGPADNVIMPFGYLIMGVLVLFVIIVWLWTLLLRARDADDERDLKRVLFYLSKSAVKGTKDVIFVSRRELPWNENDVPQIRESHRHVDGERVEGWEVRDPSQ